MPIMGSMSHEQKDGEEKKEGKEGRGEGRSGVSTL
jgi:hypothetical protein